MGKQIWLGPLLGGNRSRLIERCANLVSEGKPHSFLYLAASHPLLEIATEGILDGARNRGLFGDLPVYLFRGLVQRLLTTAIFSDGEPVAPRVPIDKDELPLKSSLVSQVLSHLMAEGKLRAIAPLANREGCVNTMVKLIGELQRAAASPAEVQRIAAVRMADLSALAEPSGGTSFDLPRQIDFDREVALIYASYCEVLDRHQLTDADADQMRALGVFTGELDGRAVTVPWLEEVELLVLDGFFDFTPVQGEILRRLIPRIPDVIVNLNHDKRNPEIFRAFKDTIEHLEGITAFDRVEAVEGAAEISSSLANLRENLFNPNTPKPLAMPALPDEAVDNRENRKDGSASVDSTASASFDASPEAAVDSAAVTYLECGDRETEIRTIAKEIKRLVLLENFSLEDIALVVRQRAAYAETIVRLMGEEGVPCSLERRVDATDVPASRAALKLLVVLEDLARDESKSLRTRELGDLIKSEYFRLSETDLSKLDEHFDTQYSGLLRNGEEPVDAERTRLLKRRHRIGFWDADALENTFAYVGTELRVTDWLQRANKLVRELPAATATRELLNIGGGEQARDPDEADQIENAETQKVDAQDAERKRRPARDIHPANIAWTAMVLSEFANRLHAVPYEGGPRDLRAALMGLLDQLCFHQQILKPAKQIKDEIELPAMLNYKSLEVLRRAFLAAVKSIELTQSPDTDRRINIVTFIDEVRRSMSAQSQPLAAPDRRGLRVLEATDVRGLRFRAVFIAGLIEGGFPLRVARDWIYPHEERQRLKRYGLVLEDISPDTLLKEEHYFYQSACRATEHLYLTRPLVLEDDSETVASYYIHELRRAISPENLLPAMVRRDYEGANLSSISRPPEMNVALIRQQERRRHAGLKLQLLPQPRIKRLLTLARNDGFLSDSALRRIEIERERAARAFGPYDGVITSTELISLLGERFGPDFTHSASGLSVFGNCPYRFFGQRVLRLEPRGEAALDLQAIDAGKLLHDILRRFFERHRRQPLARIGRDVLQQELRALADEVFDEHERVVPPLNRQIWKIDREIRKILLDQVLLYELGIQEKAAELEVLPAYFELAFGGLRSSARDPRSTGDALELSRSTFVGGETIRISGQIDRVDIAADETIIAYDYKLSTGSTKEDIKSGRSLQLPIYLEALERLLLPDHPIAGGGYYIIRGSTDRRNKGLYRASSLSYSGIGTRTKTSVLSDDDWQLIRDEALAKIWDFLDEMRAGRFIVRPAEKEKTCRFCDFAALCRYDRYRIDRKTSANYPD